MDCKKLKTQIFEFLDNELQGFEKEQFKLHLSTCEECQKEYEAIKKTWEVLGVLPKVEPSSNYMSRFWAEILTRQTVVSKGKERLKQIFLTWKMVPVYVSLLIAISAFSIRNYLQFDESRQMLAGMSQEEIEMVEYIELAENYEVIEEIDYLEDFEVIQSLDDLNITQG